MRCECVTQGDLVNWPISNFVENPTKLSLRMCCFGHSIALNWLVVLASLVKKSSHNNATANNADAAIYSA